MSQKWKSVLINWINCFFEDYEIKENITTECLSKVVTHLHKNFRPNESKSSLLEATTWEEFVREKYPVFTFENGAVQIASETEIYYAASLLLFFVCVNSKDTSIKNAMCKNLNDEEQEMVLKFNKCLMECPSITYKDVEIAILEACGKNSSIMEQSHLVTETPPVLRSLHNDVQRLRAALDAERFDKNYLQEELTRTNFTLTKVLKERDRYKEEVLMLNSRIASDFEENNKTQTQASGGKKMNAQLQRELRELELRLVDTQAVLEEVQNKCDLYKSKVENLQVERDKWVLLSETEINRVQELTEHLEKEKAERQSLLQLVSELSQHNKQNGLNSSQLECDDLDISVHSLGMNSMTCNEACANVVEVQLGEERARITQLTENLQALQDQMQLLKETTSEEKIILEARLLETTTEIENLKQQIDFEMKEKIKVTESKNNEIFKLSNELNELQQKINNILKNSKRDLESKMKEIQILQAEKVSLIQSFTNEITKMENKIQEKDLTIQSAKLNLENELNSKLKLKAEYDTCILKLNEKLSDMDREVVELQNVVLGKDNEIRNLQTSLQKQTELYQNLEFQYSSLKTEFKEQQIKFQEMCSDLKNKSEALECLKEQVKEKDNKISQFTEKCSEFTEIQEKMLSKIEESNAQKHNLEQELCNTQSMFSDEKNELEMALSQKDAALAILSLDLEQEIKIKNELVNEISQLKDDNHNLSLEIHNKTIDLKNVTSTLNGKIEELKNVICANENLEQSVMLLNRNKQELINKLTEKTDELVLFESNYKSIIEQFENSKTEKDKENLLLKEQIQDLKQTHADIVIEKEKLVEDLFVEMNEKKSIEKNMEAEIQKLHFEIKKSKESEKNLHQLRDLQIKEHEALKCQLRSLEETAAKERTTLQAQLSERNKEIENLMHQIKLHTDERVNLMELNNNEISKLINQLNDMEQKMNDVIQNSTRDLENKMREIWTLKEEKNTLIQTFTTEITKMERTIKDRDITIHNIQVNLDTEINSKLKLRDDYDKRIINLNQKLSNRNNEVVELQTGLLERSDEVESTKVSLNKQIQMYHDLENDFQNLKSQYEAQHTELQQICDKMKDKSEVLECLNGKLHESEQIICQTTKKLSESTQVNSKLLKEIDNLKLRNESLEVELKNVQNALCEEEQKLKKTLAQKDVTLSEVSLNLDKEISLKENLHKQILQLHDVNQKLSSEVDQKNSELEKINKTLNDEIKKIEEITAENRHLEQNIVSLNKIKEELMDKFKEKCDELILLNSSNKTVVDQLENSKDELQKEFSLLKQQFVDMKETYVSLLKKKDCELKQLSEMLALEKTEKAIVQKDTEFEIHKLKDEIKKLKEESEVKLQEIKDHQRNSLNSQIKLLEENAMKEKTMLEVKLLEKTTEVDNLKCQIEEKIKLIENNNAEICKYNHLLSETEQKMNNILQNTSREIENKIKEVQMLKKDKLTLVQNHAAELNTLEDIIKDKDLMLQNLQITLDTERNVKCKSKKEYENQIKVLGDKVSDSNNEIIKLQNTLLVRNNEIENTKISLQKQTKVYHDLESEYSTCKLQLEKQTKRYQDLEAEYSSCKLQYEKQTKMYQDIESEYSTCKLQYEKQIKRYQDLEVEYSTCKLQYKEQQTKLQKLCCELESKSEVIQSLNEKLHEDEEKINELTRKCAELSAECAESHIKFSKEISELNVLKNSLELKLSNVQNTFCEKRCKLETLLSQKDTDLIVITSKLEQEVDHKKKLLEEISQLNDANKDLFSQLEQKTKELEKMSNIVSSHTIELENVTLTNRTLEETITELKKDKEKLIAELKDKCDKLILCESNNKIIVDQLEQDKAELEKENATLKQNVENLRFSCDNVLTEKDLNLQQLSEESNTENSGKTAVIKNIDIQKLHDEILKANQETKFELQEIKGLHSGEYSLLKTVLRELTNLGDASVGSDGSSKRGISSGTVSVDKLEKSSDTTENHSKNCIEKQISLQKERDKLAQLCRSNESELVNVKKFLTEICVYLRTFYSVREIYTQKLSKIVSIQRIVRRDIHNLEEKLSDSVMCKLERRYAAIMQDLTEFVMNMERWTAKSVEACLTSETIKKAFKSPTPPFSSGSLQKGNLNIQLDELNLAFQKLLEEISHLPNEEMARETQPVSMMEIRAEYEDKLNRMKRKMKELYQEQIGIFRERQKQEIAILEKELMAAREKLAESSKAYEEHIRGLTTELWSVGEKFLMKKDEADWLRRRQYSGSLMSLQQMHSSGITSAGEDRPRASDTHSLRSLQPARKSDRRGFHVSDEEGEVFDNRCLKELHDTPPANPELRLSELRWRNSLCPPHLKSCYPAETQFAPSLDEDDIKSVPGASGSRQRKEVGITAYKKPGPPTPSKQAGRLSATDSELRESLRTEAELTARKTSTPSRLRALFRRHDADNSSTPRNKRLSIFRSRK